MSMLEKRDNKTLRTFKPHRLNALRGIQLDFSPIDNKYSHSHFKYTSSQGKIMNESEN